MGKAYSDEVSCIPQTLQWAQAQEIKGLRSSTRCLDRSVVAIGSGGSFTAAAYVAGLHEQKFGKLSRAASPLEVITGFGASDVAAVFLSAEGKNNDILAAAEACSGTDRGSIALTLTSANPLLNYCERSGAATPVGFDMPWLKDGYLATNTLIAMMSLFARAYADEQFDTSVFDTRWLEECRKNIAGSDALRHVAAGANVVVLYGGIGKVAAIDLESKFSEAALGSCQPVDYRQFAHGRHLQLAQQNPPVIIALGSDDDQALVNASLDLFPSAIQVLRITLPSDFASGELVGVIQAMLIVEAVSAYREIDVGQPIVPSFGRALYGTDVRESVAKFTPMPSPLLFRKIPHALAKSVQRDAWVEAGFSFLSRLEAARFTGIVCDFDGTCCYTPRRFDGLDPQLVDQFSRLLNEGVAIAFATGRGDSLQDDLRAKLSSNHWQNILLGYFSGSLIARLNDPFEEPRPDGRFSLLTSWLAEHCLIPGSSSDLKICGGQMSIRLTGGLSKESVTPAIEYWLDMNGYKGWRVFCSGHSVDVLTENVGKLNVVSKFSEAIGAKDEDQILRIGDSGHFGGNDCELLSTGLGLSVATVSPLKSSCWNLLPGNLYGAAGMLRYLSSLEISNGVARFSDEFLKTARAMILEEKGSL